MKARPEMLILTTNILEPVEELESQVTKRMEPAEATGETDLIGLTSKAKSQLMMLQRVMPQVARAPLEL